MFLGDFNVSETEASAVIVSWHIYLFNRQAGGRIAVRYFVQL